MSYSISKDNEYIGKIIEYYLNSHLGEIHENFGRHFSSFSTVTKRCTDIRDLGHIKSLRTRMLEEGLLERPTSDSNSDTFRATHYSTQFSQPSSYSDWAIARDIKIARKMRWAEYKEQGESYVFRFWWLSIAMAALALIPQFISFFTEEKLTKSQVQALITESLKEIPKQKELDTLTHSPHQRKKIVLIDSLNKK
jgi:hypothetical protein